MTGRCVAARLLPLLVSFAAVVAPAHAAPTNTLTTDAALYLPGATVSVSGSGWTCSFDGFSVSVTLFSGTTALDSVFPTVAGGSFTQTFAAPTALGSYSVEAFDQACGSQRVTFEVVGALPTTTTTSTTVLPTTTSTLATTSTSVQPTTVAPSSLPASLPGTGSGSSVVGAAAAALFAGAILVAATRRRIRRFAETG